MALETHSRILCSGGAVPVGELLATSRPLCCRPGLDAVPLSAPASWRTLRGPAVRLITRNGRDLTLSPDHPVLMRLDATSHWVDLVLGHEIELGFSLAVRTARHRARWSESPQAYRMVARPEDEAQRRFWILGAFEREDDAQLEKHVLACRYGLPDATAMTADALRKVLRTVPTEGRGEKLLRLTGHDPSQPHGTLRLLTDERLSRQMVAELLLFAGPAGHRLSVTPAAAESRGGGRFHAGDPREVRDLHDELEALQAWSKARQGGCVAGHIRLRLGRNQSYLLCPAANLVPGARVPVVEHGEKLGEDVVTELRLRHDVDRVWDPHLAGAHTLVAEDVVLGLQFAPEGRRPS